MRRAALFAVLIFIAVLNINGFPGSGHAPSSSSSTSSNSLIFTAASSQFLSATGKTNASTTKGTFAFWEKLASTGSQYDLWLSNDGTNNNLLIIFFTSTNNLEIETKISNSVDANLITTATYTDTSNWHHFVIAFDTTQATAANRVIIYFDGTQVSSFSTTSYPSQNDSINMNFAHTFCLGNGGISCISQYYNGKFAQFYYIDGQQLTPSSFITGTPGVPKTYSGTYTGNFDFFLPFSNGTSTTTLGTDSSGESNNWTLNNMTTANQSSDYP